MRFVWWQQFSSSFWEMISNRVSLVVLQLRPHLYANQIDLGCLCRYCSVAVIDERPKSPIEKRNFKFFSPVSRLERETRNSVPQFREEKEKSKKRVCGKNWNPILWRWCCWRTHNGHRNNCTCIRGGEMQWNALNGSWWSSVPFKWHFIRQPKSQLQGDLTKKLSHGTSQGLFNSSLSTEVCTVG